MSETDENPVGYGALIRQNRNFRWLWLGQVVSMLGDWFNMIGAAALMGKLTGSDFAVGILLMLRMLAPFAVAPIAGICADRFNRKHILMGGIGTIVVGALLDVFPSTSLVLWGMLGLPLIPALLWWLWLAARRSAEKTEGKSR